jgi:hypothetical protein
MRNISHKNCRENQNTHFRLKKIFPQNRALYEITWKNIVQPDRPQMTVKYSTEKENRFACCVSKATDTHP